MAKLPWYVKAKETETMKEHGHITIEYTFNKWWLKWQFIKYFFKHLFK